jgi:hypothetical protein
VQQENFGAKESFGPQNAAEFSVELRSVAR